MKLQRIYWNIKMLTEEALKYNNKGDFKECSSSAYQTACARGLIDMICKHMPNINIHWTDERLLNEALKYNTRSEFRLSTNAYNTAWRKGILDSICSHMEDTISGFNIKLPAIKYYIKFESENLLLYKIGITNRKTNKRLMEMHIPKTWKTTILQELHFDIGADALLLETTQKQQFKEHQYKGKYLLLNGNTELFIIDVLGLDSHPVMNPAGTSKLNLNSSSAA
jgi:hypothetical protein